MAKRKNIVLVLSMALALGASTTHASSVATNQSANDAFQNLLGASVQTYSAGSFSAGARNVHTGGGARVRFATSNVQLISVTPPSYSAGCSGIDFTFGSFSYIDGSQIEQLIKNIMANSTGFVVQQGIRLFCPICADVLATMQDLAQMANSMSIDSCNAAQNLVQAGMDKLGIDGNSQQRTAKSMCSNEYSQSSGSTDFFKAMSSGCENFKQSVNRLTDWMNGRPDKNSSAAKYADLVGNKTWMVLTDMGISSTAVKELFLTTNGYTKTRKGFAIENYEPQTSSYAGWSGQASKLIDLLLVGYEPSSFSRPENFELEAIYRLSQGVENEVFVLCNEANGNATPANTPATTEGTFLMCQNPVHVKVKDLNGRNPLISRHGLLADVEAKLTSAAKKVRLGQPLSADEVALIQMSPLPVYRMLNIAAVYPDISLKLIAEYSNLIAILIAEGVLNAWIGTPQNLDNKGAAQAEFHVAKQTVREMINTLMEAQKREQSRLVAAYQWQDELMSTLNLIHQAIVREASHSGIVGSMAFGEMVARGVGNSRPAGY